MLETVKIAQAVSAADIGCRALDDLFKASSVCLFMPGVALFALSFPSKGGWKNSVHLVCVYTVE